MPPTMMIDGLEIPQDVWTLDGFREWAGALDERAPRVHFSRHRIQIEMSPQNGVTHGPVVQAINFTLAGVVAELDLGEYFTPPTWFTHEPTGLSTEPDGFAVRWRTLECGGFQINPRRPSEWLGRPDMALEVVSETTVRKDTRDLAADYAQAGVEEYWIADARGEAVSFRILVLSGNRYVEQPADGDGWTPSPFYARSFRLVRFRKRAELVGYRLEMPTAADGHAR